MSNVDLHAAALNTLLAAVRSWLDDPTVSEIMINGPAHVFVERAGKLEPVEAAFADAGDVLAALRNVAQFAGTFVDDEHPLLEARLPDGSRLAAVLSPIAEGGPVVSIRKFSRTAFDLEALVAHESLDPPTARLLRALVLGKCNVLVSGGTGSGKTSLLNVLTALVPERERVLVLEDTREIDARRAHVVYLTARSADDFGRGAVTITQLFRTSLRMRPDRLVIGELRGGEALDLVQAMVSGHGGCLSTLHASHPEDALTRLETMCMMSEISVPLAAIRMQIGSGVHAIVQVDRAADGSRKITHVSAVAGYDQERGEYRVEDLIVREYQGLDERGRLRSGLRATGAVPRFAERLRAQGIDTGALFAQQGR